VWVECQANVFGGIFLIGNKLPHAKFASFHQKLISGTIDMGIIAKTDDIGQLGA
jgi:hypothetical protein